MKFAEYLLLTLVALFLANSAAASECVEFTRLDGAKKAVLFNSCSECKRAIVRWHSGNKPNIVKKYNVPAQKERTVVMERPGAKVIGEEACKF